MRVLEVGAAKCWAGQHLLPLGVDYVATDILDDPKIGLGRGAFFGDFPRVQADAEHLPFADGSFDLAYCVATLHHALDLPDGRRARAGDPARRHRRGAERGHESARRGPARTPSRNRRRSSGSTSTSTRCPRTSGHSGAPASGCSGSSRPRATTTCGAGASRAGCSTCRSSGARPRRSSPRAATGTRASVCTRAKSACNVRKRVRGHHSCRGRHCPARPGPGRRK